MIEAIAAALVGGIALPHLLRLREAAPLTATAVWLSGLALRAALTGLAVVLLLFFLPRTDAFAALTHWCLVAFEGHAVGDSVLYVPGLFLGAALVRTGVGIARDARSVRRLVAGAICAGPDQSVVVGGRDVVFAVAGLAHPKVVVSAGALASLDDEELAAALDHERAHIARRHRFVMVTGITCCALGRPVPGARHALAELAFHLERDADRWSVERRNDRLALASAICKAAAGTCPDSASAASLGATGVRERLRQLVDEPPVRPRAAAAALNAVALVMVAGTLLFAAGVPAAAVAGATGDAHGSHHGGHCHH